MVTASSCLGATEGWVSAGDKNRGLALIGDRSAAAVVPMVEFSPVDERFFLRIQHTAAESDDTRASFLRGTRTFSFALLGHDANLDTVRRAAQASERGLVVRTEKSVGLVGGV